jgi:hypothetical protein
MARSDSSSRRAFLCGMNLDFKKMDGLVTAVIQDYSSGVS